MRGYGYGRGSRGAWWGGAAVSPAAGYTYLGPCRCGTGPHAYYQDANGQVLTAAQVFRPAQPAAARVTQTELERLRAEKADLERRLAALEERLKAQGTPGAE